MIKCTIDNGVICESEKVRLYIESQLKTMTKKIKHISFYVYVETFEDSELDILLHPLLNVKFEMLPVYKKGMNLETFIEDFCNFSNIDTKGYDTHSFEEVKYDFSSKESCIARRDDPHNTNPSFPHFKQSVFHAGNKKQIDRYGILPIKSLFEPSIGEKPVGSVCYNFDSIVNTISYMFEYLKKGILVGIKNNKIALYLPMSNANYKNHFFEELYFNDADRRDLRQLKDDPKNKTILRKTEETVKQYFKRHNIPMINAIYDRRRWYVNGCLVRFDKYEGEKLVLLLLDFLSELCKSRTINDCIFIINTRDFPVLRRDRKCPNTQVTDQQIPSKYGPNFCPILSASVTDEYEDISMVTHDDWLRISQRFYPESCNNTYYEMQQIFVPWEEKINKVIFRGSATGCGMTEDTNQRLKVNKLGKLYPDVLDVGLIGFNYRMKKNFGQPVQVINNYKMEKANYIDNKTKATYKYILNIDGHVNAFRLGVELQSGSLILLVESENKIWISNFIQPYVHYVPIKSDLSDIIDIVNWCKANDDKCKQISMNAAALFEEKLGKEHIFDYMQCQLNKFVYVKEDVPTPKCKIGIVLCYRDNESNSRLYELVQYKYYMSKMLDDAKVDYRFVVCEQVIGDKFNIGKIKNIGYKYLTEKEPDIDFFIFSDIDMIPNSDLLPYFSKVTDGMSMFATRGTRYDNGNLFLGGCIGCTKNTFEQINGYSNCFDRGWGSEDDNLILRCIEEKINFFQPKVGNIIDIEGENKNIKNKILELKQSDNYNMERYEIMVQYKNYKEDGLGNCLHNILDESYINKTYHIIVDPLHADQRSQYPNHFSGNFSDKVMEGIKQLKHLASNNVIIY